MTEPTAATESPPDATPDEPSRARIGLLRGTFLGMRADVVSALSMVLVSIVVSRALGPADRGVFFLAAAVALVFALVGDLGMSTAGIVFGANRRVPLRELHGVALGFSLVAGAFGALLLLPAQDFWTSHVLKGLDTVVLIELTVAIAPLLYAQIMIAQLTGQGHIPVTATLRIAQAVVYPILVTPVVIATHSPEWAVATWLFTTVLYAFAMGFYATRLVAPPKLPSVNSVRTVVSFGTRSYVGTLAHHGFLRVDVFFLSARYGPATVGIYSLSSVVAEKISLLGQAIYAASASHIGSSSPDDAARLAARVIRTLILVLVPAAALLAALAWPGFPLLFGDAFQDAALPFVILLPGTVSLTLWYLVSLYVISSLGRPGLTTLIQGSALLVSIPLYFFAVREWEMTGAAIVSSLVYGSVLTMGIVVLLRTSPVRMTELLPSRADVAQLAGLARSAVRRVHA